jgi:hypothetical protein
MPARARAARIAGSFARVSRSAIAITLRRYGSVCPA